jgi:hypothetical protein
MVSGRWEERSECLGERGARVRRWEGREVAMEEEEPRRVGGTCESGGVEREEQKEEEGEGGLIAWGEEGKPTEEVEDEGRILGGWPWMAS